MRTRTSKLKRWGLVALAALAVALGLRLAHASTAPQIGKAPIATADDLPDYGEPKEPLQKAGKDDKPGTGSNQNGSKFPHYGRVEVPLCDLPKGFMDKDDNQQRAWCRRQLADKFGMTNKFTNHELVETKRDGSKVLAIYKVDMKDHSSSGRPLLYHPPRPEGTPKQYWGGIAQLKTLDKSCFKPKKDAPKKSALASGFPSRGIGPGGDLGSETCDQCACALCGDPQPDSFCGDDSSWCSGSGPVGTATCP
jgi:hypothetical protein